MEKKRQDNKESEQGDSKKIESLTGIIETLRGKDGCPWDRKQTPKTMSLYLIEEMFELVEAIESGTPDEVCEELGDVLFHIMFIVSIYYEKGHFSINDAVSGIYEKMIRRHPHVFGEVDSDNVEDIKKRWHEIKMKEKNHAVKESILDSVPSGLPALMRAYRVSSQVGRAGFDWDDIHGVIKKVDEEWGEFKSELGKGDKESISMELGDVFFTLVNVARFAGLHPETALKDSTAKFEKRYRHLEKCVAVNRKTVDTTSREKLDQLWGKAKKET